MAFSQPVTAISNALLGLGASGLNRYHNSICCVAERTVGMPAAVHSSIPAARWLA